jgi:hypothetical protein
MDLWATLKILSMIATGGFAAMALLKKNKDDGGKINRWGKFALVGIALSTIFSLILFAMETSKAREEAAKAKVDADNAAKTHQDIQDKARINLEETANLKLSSAETLKQQQLNLKRSDEIAEGMERSLDAQQAALRSNKEILKEQGRSIRQMNRLSLDRNLSGVEISFTPSVKQWSKITKAYQKIKSPVPDMPYIDAPMIAEKDGAHWRIDFGPVKRPEGDRLFAPVSTNQSEYKGFEDVIHEATIALWIKWSNIVEIDIEPWRKVYPSGIRVARDSIVLILRPPELRLNLNYLYENRSIIVRVRDPQFSLRIRSTDLSVMFDQTISSDSKRSDGLSVPEKAKPYASGPHNLKVTFKSISR